MPKCPICKHQRQMHGEPPPSINGVPQGVTIDEMIVAFSGEHGTIAVREAEEAQGLFRVYHEDHYHYADDDPDAWVCPW